MFKSPGHIAFSIYSIDVYWYGIIMALAILFGVLFILFIKNKYFKDISTDSVIDSSLVIIISGILCARLYYVLLDYKYFIQHPLQIPCIWNGGISIQGAILGSVIAFWIYSKKKNLNFFRYADLFVFGGILGQIIGRWGNFFNSEAFGLPTNLPWKLYIPYNMRPVEYKSFEYFHPTFLYESMLNIPVLIILYLTLKYKKDLKPGTIFCMYLILYSAVRIIVEAVRTDSVLNVYGLHAAHIASIFLILFAIVCLICPRKFE